MKVIDQKRAIVHVESDELLRRLGRSDFSALHRSASSPRRIFQISAMALPALVCGPSLQESRQRRTALAIASSWSWSVLVVSSMVSTLSRRNLAGDLASQSYRLSS